MGRKPMTDLEKQLKQQLRDLEREDKRDLEILFIVWEPLCYDSDLLTKLSSLGVPMFVGPVHDKDVKPDGTPKKAHRHCGAKYRTKKYLATFYDELKQIFGEVDTRISFDTGDSLELKGETSCYCISYPQKVKGTFSGAVRYTKHIDNPEKYQYDEDPVGLVGLDVYEYLLTSSDETSIISEITQFILAYDIRYPHQFINCCIMHNKHMFLSLYTRKKTYLINCIMKGQVDFMKEARERP